MGVRTTCDKVGTQYRKFNDFVRGELDRQNKKQTDLADHLGVKQPTIACRLDGSIKWGLKDALKTLDFLDAKFEDFL